MTRRRAAWAALLVALLRTCATSPAFADTCPKMTAVQAGTPTPCDGILWPAAWTVEAIRCRSVLLPSCRADLQHEQTVCQADRAAAEERIGAASALAAERLQLLEQALAMPPPKAPDKPLVGPWAAAAIGAAAGVSVTAWLWWLSAAR